MKSVLILLLLTPLWAFSQSESQDIAKKERSIYLNMAVGKSSSRLRDFATSPLFYEGSPLFLSVSRSKVNERRESEIGISYSFGNYTKTFEDHGARSNVKTLSLSYNQLYQLRNLSSEKFNFKIGGLFKTTTNLRLNQSLLNNGAGIEVIPTLFGSVRAQLDISRKESKKRKFLFVKYKLKPKTRNLAYRLNVGVVNSSFRNGYVYISHGNILNEGDFFSDYEFKVFSGFRMSSALDYTVMRANKNAIRLSYLWDAFQTAGDFEKLEMSSHTFMITFMFNSNNK